MKRFVLSVLALLALGALAGQATAGNYGGQQFVRTGYGHSGHNHYQAQVVLSSYGGYCNYQAQSYAAPVAVVQSVAVVQQVVAPVVVQQVVAVPTVVVPVVQFQYFQPYFQSFQFQQHYRNGVQRFNRGYGR